MGLVPVQLELRHGARGPAQPFAPLRRAAERASCCFRILERRDARCAAQGCRGALRADEDAEDGLVGDGCSRPADRRSDLLLVRADGRDEEDDRGVERGIPEDGRKRGGEALGRCAAEQVDRVRGASLGRHDLGERRQGRVARRRQLEAGCLTGVRREDAEAAGIRHERDPPSARHRLRREQRRDVDQLVERPRADHARLAEERVDGHVRAGEGRGVRACGAAAGAGAPALQRENRLAARDLPRDPRERTRVAEGLEVEDDHLGRVVVLPPLEQVVRRDVRLVADRHERGDAETGRLRPFEQREPERAALRGEADLSGREAARREGRVEVDRGGGDAEAVRAEQARAVLAGEGQELLLPLDPLAARLGEPRGDDDERAYAGGERVLGGRRAPARRGHR